MVTRQSEMANTSPCHMPVLGNVHPIKIENFDFFFRDVTSLLARVFIFLIDMATRGSHGIYLKEIVGPVFEIYAIELLGTMSTDKA